MKTISLVVLLLSSLLADVVLVSTKDTAFKQNLDYGDLKLSYIDEKVHCKMFDKQKLLNETYQAIRYIPKGKPICEKDVKKVIEHKVEFNFGNIQIIKDGEYLGETKEYIKIKNTDGSVDRIYKDGTLK